MPPVDPSSLLASFPHILMVAIIVNIVMWGLQFLLSGGLPNNADNWWNRFESRFGPLVSVAVGFVVGLLWSDAGWALGAIGGWGAAWNFNFFQATVRGR